MFCSTLDEVGSGPRAPVLDAFGLTKRFGARKAVDGLSLSLFAGEVLGLLGPNGAGKSTTMLLLAGVLRAEAGGIQVNGRSQGEGSASRNAVGYAPQEIALYAGLTVRENARLFARLRGLTSPALEHSMDKALAMARLVERADDRVGALSGGMQRRLNLALATLHSPDILLLDEPTVGVDPHSRNHIFECIEELKANGTSIVYSTHYIEEAERLCDRVAVIDHGKIVALGPVDELVRRHSLERRFVSDGSVSSTRRHSSLEAVFLSLTSGPSGSLR